MPWTQADEARRQTVAKIANARGFDIRNRNVRTVLEDHLYGSRKLMENDRAVNRTYALQGLGDNEPLGRAMQQGLSDLQLLTHVDEVADHVEPPVPYTPLMGRKLAQGNFWPSAPTQGPNSKVREYHRLRNEDTSSPSSNRFTAAIEYYIRRNLRAMPAHLAENIDFSQLMIDRVYGSRRSQYIYIVWSTVDPLARRKIEPYLVQLDNWLIRMILKRIKIRPNIPKLFWVYNAGECDEMLPKSLVQEIKASSEKATETIEERVAYLKAADSLQHRMKGIPWFMPYLWAKDKRAKQESTMRGDLSEWERRKDPTAANPNTQPKQKILTWEDYKKGRNELLMNQAAWAAKPRFVA